MFDKARKNLELVSQLVQIVNQDEITAMSKFLYERICHPESYVVFLGETSCGKSSLINGCLGENILPVKAYPSTAAITEIEVVSDHKGREAEFYAINKNATIEKLQKDVFLNLAEHPDSNLNRLKLVVHGNNSLNGSLRLFDTPGYGSIVEEHEEVLKDFLPNSDLVVYTVNYKIGIQDEDYIFLGFLKELIRPEVKVILLVNRCPEGINVDSPKIKKIRKTVSDILLMTPKTFVVQNIVTEEEHCIVKCDELWKYITKEVSSPERMASLDAAFNKYVKDLYDKCYSVIETRFLSSQLEQDELRNVRKIQIDTAERIRQAVSLYIEPTFSKILKSLPDKFDNVVENVTARIYSAIDKSDTTDMDEMVGYINAHLLPFYIKTETNEEIQNYVQILLDDLNQKVDDYIQQEFIKFNNNITVAINSHVDGAVSEILSGFIKCAGRDSLEAYFVAFGGNGLANAGIANAASHLLKEAGDLVGHTFSRSTHNGLTHFLSKVGATSMKTIGVVFSALTELAFTAYELATWKGKLKSKVEEQLNEWKEKTLPVVLQDLAKLEDTNVETVIEIAKNISESFDDVKVIDMEKCKADYELSLSIGKNIID